MPWWGWLTLAWLAFNAAFLVAWSLRVRPRDPARVDEGARVPVRARVTTSSRRRSNTDRFAR